LAGIERAFLNLTLLDGVGSLSTKRRRVWFADSDTTKAQTYLSIALDALQMGKPRLSRVRAVLGRLSHIPQSTICGSACQRPTPAPRSQRPHGQGLELDAKYAPRLEHAHLSHLHHLPMPRHLPAVCCRAKSFRRPSLDLARRLLAPLVLLWDGAQRTATCAGLVE
jgi:hypothetical protein